MATNPLMESFSAHEGFYAELKKYKLLSSVNQDMVRKLYSDFAATDEYKKYVYKLDYELADHQEIILSLYKFCSKHELFVDAIEDVFPNYIDDDSLIIGAMKKTLKKLPTPFNFYEEFIPDAETVEEYGTDLLYKITHLDKDLLEIIEPALQNWDAERVAILDMILLKMAICEFLYFPTIPTKVTINEYIDVSKMYSTPKSKDFINGILDRLLKKLVKEEKNQQGRKRIERLNERKKWRFLQN